MAYWKQSSFSRLRENEKKMGAYYTDLSHCRDIHKMFRFPKGEEVCVLEPSIGDGSAVIAVTGADTNPDIKIFGVELNDKVAQDTKNNPYITDVLKADFTDGVQIRNRCFSFCFGNPPYMSEQSTYGEGKVRIERLFLNKVLNYLRTGGILVWVVPYSVFSDLSYLRGWMLELDTLALFKFRKEEYEKWHQVVVVGRKRQKRAVSVNMLNECIQQWGLADIDLIPELPGDLEPTIEVLPSEEKGVDLFAPIKFNADLAADFLDKGLSSEFKQVFSAECSQKEYEGGRLSRPPIPLKKDSKYLLVTSGFTDGVVGSEEDGDIHMMRGVANVVEQLRYESAGDDMDDPDNGTNRIVATTTTEVELRVLEADGTLTLLQ